MFASSIGAGARSKPRISSHRNPAPRFLCQWPLAPVGGPGATPTAPPMVDLRWDEIRAPPRGSSFLCPVFCLFAAACWLLPRNSEPAVTHVEADFYSYFWKVFDAGRQTASMGVTTLK